MRDGGTSDPMSRGWCAVMLLRVVYESVCAQDTILALSINRISKKKEEEPEKVLEMMRK